MKIMSTVNYSNMYRLGKNLSRPMKEAADLNGADEKTAEAADGRAAGEAGLVKDLVGKPSKEAETAEKAAGMEKESDPAEETAVAQLKALMEKNREEEDNGFGLLSGASGSDKSGKIRASSGSQEDSVGQLASQLANAETDMAVREIQGKVMRALVNLKMAAGLSEGKEKEKLSAQIRRMEKLQKKVIKKLKQLSHEAELEREREKAIKEQQEEKAKEAERELKTGRKKRRREEQEYAKKECMKDKQSSDPSEMFSAAAGAGSASAGSPAAVSGAGAASADVSAAGGYADVSMPVEGAFVDVSV